MRWRGGGEIKNHRVGREEGKERKKKVKRQKMKREGFVQGSEK